MGGHVQPLPCAGHVRHVQGCTCLGPANFLAHYSDHFPGMGRGGTGRDGMGKGSEKKLRVAEQDGAGNDKILKAKNHLIFVVFIVTSTFPKTVVRIL